MSPQQFARLTDAFVSVEMAKQRQSLGGDEVANLFHHVGGRLYAVIVQETNGVNLSYVDKDIFTGVYSSKGGICMKEEEWDNLMLHSATLRGEVEELDTARACTYDEDHQNQPGMINCIECTPFGDFCI